VEVISLVEIKKEKLIERIFKWAAKDAEVTIEKERLLKIMIEATLDYLYTKGYLDVDMGEKNNGKN